MTPNQKRVLDFVTRQIRQTGISPSLDEIAAEIGLKGRSGVHRIVSALVRDGYLLRTPEMPRSLRLPSPPSGVTASHELVAAAEYLLERISREDKELGVSVVCADALGRLDIAVAENRADQTPRAVAS